MPTFLIEKTAPPGGMGRARLILALGISSLVVSALAWLMCCIPLLCLPISLSGIGLGLPALVLGLTDRHRIKAGLLDPPRTRGTTGGWVCALIGTLLGAAVLVLVLYQVLA